jgi:DNA-binding transcriptional LysR family regulator
MELRQLSYFIAVAEELHFARAAARLNVAEPALSRQIRQMERELNVQLFDRTTRSVRMTGAGTVFLDEARRALLQVGHAVSLAQQAQRGEAGELLLGFGTSAAYDVLPRLVRAYHARYPQVEIKPQHFFGRERLRALEERRIHVGIVHQPRKHETLLTEIIQREPMLLALPEAHPLAKLDSIPIAALSSEVFIVASAGQARGTDDETRPEFHELGLRPREIQVVPDTLTKLGLVSAGIGVALIASVTRMLMTQGVVFRELADAAPQQVTALAWHRDERSPTVQGLIAVARDLAKLGENARPGGAAA